MNLREIESLCLDFFLQRKTFSHRLYLAEMDVATWYKQESCCSLNIIKQHANTAVRMDQKSGKYTKRPRPPTQTN